MLRLIRDEKEEAERKEGMEGGQSERESSPHRGTASFVGTPRFDEGGTPLPDGEGNEGIERWHPARLKVPPQPMSRSTSRAPSIRNGDGELKGEKEDTTTDHGTEQPQTPAGTNITSELEEGEAEEDNAEGGIDGMDVS